ncbi:cytochrome c oxidase assembly protein [Rathayibacter sp. AY1A5]|nr:cytochrome c oxidase assembly protein [Rathayibacter sp. AY1A5]
MGRSRRPQAAPGAPGALRRRPAALRLRLDRLRSGAAGGGPAPPASATARDGVTPHADHTLLDLGLLLLVPLAAVAALGGGAAALERRRGRPWPLHRTALLLGGLATAALCFTGPLAEWSHADPRGAMLTHLVLGMLAPLLLVLSAPVTLALRALDVTAARRLSRLLRSRPARLLAHPVTALLLSTGSLWLVHATGLLATAHADPLLHLALSVHFLLSGCLMTAALAGVDPNPHRAPFGLRLGVLGAGIAAHGLLATVLYAEAPDETGRQAALLLFYGGDLLETALAVVVCARRYAATAPRQPPPPSAPCSLRSDACSSSSGPEPSRTSSGRSSSSAASAGSATSSGSSAAGRASRSSSSPS